MSRGTRTPARVRVRTCALGLVLLGCIAALPAAGCGGEASPASAPPSAQATPSPSATPSGERLSQWDGPGSAGLAQTVAVAERYAGAVHAETVPQAHLYTAASTFDSWSGDQHLRGAGAIADAYREASPSLDWPGPHHIMAAPGVGVYEGTLLVRSTATYSTPSLATLAVDGDKVVHEEIFLDTRVAPIRNRPVETWNSPPGVHDTPVAAFRVGATVGAAFATADSAALRAVSAADVLFYDTAEPHARRGWKALLDWWSRVPEVELENRRPVAGPGWVVVGWTMRQVDATGDSKTMPGATVMEVRHGKVVRMTLYYDAAVIRLQP
jgi:hypothetical protein